jgi:hypothetical protein
MDLRERVLEDVDWIHMALDRDQLWDGVNMVINLQGP